MLHAGAEKLAHETRRAGARALGAVQHQPQPASRLVKPAFDHLALHNPARIENGLARRLARVKQRGIEQEPGEHVLIGHRL